MAIVLISLDTNSRQTILTIDGVLVSTSELHLRKNLKIDKEDEFEVSFGYTTEGVDHNGLKEKRYFFLPTPEDVFAKVNTEVNEDGFASKVVHDDKKVGADVIDFLRQSRGS